MSIHVALNHRTSYRYERKVELGPQVVRLRPAPHCRTEVLAYSMKVLPETHFINWQQDPFSNYLGRLVFPKKTDMLRVDVDLGQVELTFLSAAALRDFALALGYEHVESGPLVRSSYHAEEHVPGR